MINVLLSLIFAFLYGMFFLTFPALFNAIIIVFIILIALFVKKQNASLQCLVVILPILYGESYFTSIFTNSIFGIGILGVLNILLPLLIFFSLTARRVKNDSFVLNVPIAVFLFILGVSVFYSPSFMQSAREWFRIAMPLAVYYLVLNIALKNEERSKYLLKISRLVVMSSLIPVCFALFQFINHDARFQFAGFSRVYGTFGHPNTLSAFLIICMTLLLFIAANEKRVWKRLVFSVYMLIMFFLLILTFSRIGWLAFFVCFTIIGVTKYRKNYFLILSVFIIVFFCLPSISTPILSRLTPDPSFYLRFSLNKFSIDLFTESPFIGHGLASYPFLSKEHFGVVSANYGQEVGLPQHNDYLKFLTDSGIIGLFAYLFLIMSSLKLGFCIEKQKSSFTSLYGICLIAIIGAMLTLGISDMGLRMMSIYPWILLGVGESMLKKPQFEADGFVHNERLQ